MSKEKKERFIVEFRLETDESQDYILNKRMEIGRRIYNQCVSKTRKQYREMVKMRKYRDIQAELKSIREQKKEKDRKKKTDRERELYAELNEIRKEFGFTEFGMKSLALAQSGAFSRHIDSGCAVSIGTQLWAAWDDFFFGNGDDVRFRKYGEFNSLQGMNNKSGITIRKDAEHRSWTGKKTALIWGKTVRCINMAIPLRIRKDNLYEMEALENEIANSRIIRKSYKGKDTFYVQIVFKGVPPVKYDKDGNVLHPLGKGRVEAVLTSKDIRIITENTDETFDLAENVENFEDKKKEIHQAMTRSRIATNPDKYNPDGTNKELSEYKDRHWVRSGHYMKLKNELKELNRKSADIRKADHYKLANLIVSMGDEFIITHPDFKKKQKEEGKSIADRAPSAFLNILERKICMSGGTFTKIKEEETSSEE